MPSIFPGYDAGGLDVRDIGGVCLSPPTVENAYCPAPAYVVSPCLVTALPSDCTARIQAKQINAIVSELVSFSECLSPTGPWDCNSLNNLCIAFQTWLNTIKFSGITISDTAPAGPKHEDLWWESDSGNTYLYYDDGNSPQWVQIAPGSGTGGGGGPPFGITQPDADLRYVNITGDTMTGPLFLLSTPPTLPEEAANKEYVDQKASMPTGGLPGQALVINAASSPQWGAPIDGGTY